MDWKILLIDDDPGIRRVQTITLEQAGYEVVTAPDGERGMRVYREQSPQIVITDIGMPGMDGLEVLRRIKEAAPDTQVIVATAFTELALAIKAMQLDASGFVIKPVSDDALTSALKCARERYLKRKELHDYTARIEERWMDTAEALARTFHFQEMLIESSIDGIVACGREGKIIIFNRSMEQMLGYARKQVIGKMLLWHLFPAQEAQRFQDRLYAQLRAGAPRLYPFATVLTDAGGAAVPVLLSATVLFEGEEEVGTVVYFRDRHAAKTEDILRSTS